MVVFSSSFGRRKSARFIVELNRHVPRSSDAEDGYSFRALHLGCPSDASLARAQWRKNGFVKKGALTLAFSVPVSCLSFLPLPGSSVAEQVTVNHLVVGSIPT